MWAGGKGGAEEEGRDPLTKSTCKNLREPVELIQTSLEYGNENWGSEIEFS